MDLRTIVAEAEKLLRKQGAHPPTIVVAFEGIATPVRFSLSSFPATAEARRHALFLKGTQVAQHYRAYSVQRVWFIAEMWMSLIDDGSRLATAPSQDPKRREVLMVLELDASSESLVQKLEVRRMRRNKRKQVTALTPLPELASVEGKITPVGAPALSFLAGFAEVAASQSASGPLYRRILYEQAMMDQLLNKNDV